jgi:hypothetical protein
MGADRSYRRTRPGQTLAVLMVLGSFMAGASATAQVAVTAADHSPTGKVASPKTVAQCKKAFKRGSKARSVCIKRVEGEKPGSSCTHPLFSGESVDGSPSQKSDTKDFIVKFKLDSETKPKEALPGDFTTFQAEVIVYNPRLVMCRVVVSEFKGSGRTYPLKIGPHGGLSSRLTLASSIIFGILGYARLG